MSNKILLMGNPNSGKTLLFNQLTGLKRKVANFPGVTVEISSGKSLQNPTIEFVDFPGIYSLEPLTADEKIAVESLEAMINSRQASAIVCVLDATRIQRSLYLALQLIRIGKKHAIPVIAAFNMMDELINSSKLFDFKKMEEALGISNVGISARKKQGLTELLSKIENVIADPKKNLPTLEHPEDIDQLKNKAKQIESQLLPNVDVVLKSQNTLDKVFLSNWWGGIIFLCVMLVLFQAIFTWAAPFMDIIDAAIVSLGEWTASFLPDGILKDFTQDAIFGGLGSFLVFVPQIAVLTLIIGFLEDSGYLVRAAIICHKPLSLFGLSGKSFIPLLSGHACAIPAIFAARTIESSFKRKLTMAVIPLTSCSARLPVYALIVTALIPDKPIIGGFIGYQGLAFFACYVLGVVVALFVSAIVYRWRSGYIDHSSFVVELPPYRWPHWKPLMQKMYTDSMAFIHKAGGIIFVVTVTIWILGYFPNGPEHLDTSYLSYLGHWIEPILKPLELDWKFGIAILTSFLAREVFVGTLGTLYGIEDASENVEGLSQVLLSHNLSFAAGSALLVFFVIAPQCISTLAVLKQEAGSWKLPVQIFVGYTALAYAFALITYTIINAF